MPASWMAVSTIRQPPFGIIARLRGGVGLQADDHVVVLANVARLEGVNVGGGVRVDVEDAHLALLGEVVLLQGVPQVRGLLSGAS